MELKDIQLQLEEINSKLNFIMEEVELQKKHRLELQDFKEDIIRVIKDLYVTSLEELEQVHDYLKTGDILDFFKKFLRNINNLAKFLEQLENVRDFLKDFGPISKSLSKDLMNKLDEFDRKGYFEFMKEAQGILDNIVTSFTVDDVKALSDNIVTILNIVKNLTQPDMLTAINNAVNVYKKLDIEIKEDVSLLKLIKELNTLETKKALFYSIQFLKKLSTLNEPQTNIK